MPHPQHPRNRHARRSCRAAAPAATGTDALAQILGTLEIGNPLPALPDCADHRTPDGKDVTALCVELRGDGTMRQIGVPRDKRPVFMDGPHLLAFVDGNALVGVMVPTDGIRRRMPPSSRSPRATASRSARKWST
jgi:hypothetical protein